MTILVLIGMFFAIIWDNPWEDIFKLSASAAAIELCEWVEVGIESIRSGLTYLYDFQLLVLLP